MIAALLVTALLRTVAARLIAALLIAALLRTVAALLIAALLITALLRTVAALLIAALLIAALRTVAALLIAALLRTVAALLIAALLRTVVYVLHLRLRLVTLYRGSGRALRALLGLLLNDRLRLRRRGFDRLRLRRRDILLVVFGFGFFHLDRFLCRRGFYLAHALGDRCGIHFVLHRFRLLFLFRFHSWFGFLFRRGLFRRGFRFTLDFGRGHDDLRFIAADMVYGIGLAFTKLLEPFRALVFDALLFGVLFFFYKLGFRTPHLGKRIADVIMGFLYTFKELLRFRFKLFCRIHEFRFRHHSTPVSFCVYAASYEAFIILTKLSSVTTAIMRPGLPIVTPISSVSSASIPAREHMPR